MNLPNSSDLEVPLTYDKIDFELNGPMIVKPNDSKESSKDDFFIIESKNDEDQFNQNKKVDIDYSIQQYIYGDSRNMYEVIGSYSHSKDIFTFFPIRKIRQFPLTIRSSSYVESTELPKEIINNVKEFLRLFNYEGYFDLELKKCESSNKFYFIECNFRLGAPLSIVSKYNNKILTKILYEYDQVSEVDYLNHSNKPIGLMIK